MLAENQSAIYDNGKANYGQSKRVSVFRATQIIAALHLLCLGYMAYGVRHAVDQNANPSSDATGFRCRAGRDSFEPSSADAG